MKPETLDWLSQQDFVSVPLRGIGDETGLPGTISRQAFLGTNRLTLFRAGSKTLLGGQKIIFCTLKPLLVERSTHADGLMMVSRFGQGASKMMLLNLA